MDLPQTGQEKHERAGKGQCVPLIRRGRERADQPRYGQQELLDHLPPVERAEILPLDGVPERGRRFHDGLFIGASGVLLSHALGALRRASLRPLARAAGALPSRCAWGPPPPRQQSMRATARPRRSWSPAGSATSAGRGHPRSRSRSAARRRSGRRRSSFLLRLRNDPDVRFRRLPAIRIRFLRLVV